MPLCFIYTNLKSECFGEDFEENFISCLADTLSKPKDRITVILNAGSRMTYAGEKQDGVLCQIHSIGVFDQERNPDYFHKLCSWLSAETKLEPSRITLQFIDLPAHMVKKGL
ncbi:uncharacterized protein LOC127846732 [Dreissena polymorpha]|uniref:D-dopachrome decarboxylase n=1 Tax=Dreissena polymorpha TaxID=45954 RepID=A0A9D4S0T5_DREPO|nr:uncharacterized protein LOC127846732 [Dreissena polymorpha]KAH3888284.1 hypothetical protein DPMN_012316 [Dreissena polymorpha]